MRTKSPDAHQRSFDFRTWGGVRSGAGPKLRRPRPAAPHRPRVEVRPYHPVHATVRVLAHVWNLRSQRSFAVIHRALSGVRRRPDFRVTHFSVQGNHVHLIVEADGARALATGMRALSIRIARGLNAMMGRTGPIFEDRYHAHPLKTPAEARNAMHYVLGNFASHAERRGEPVRDGFVDPFSSAASKGPRSTQTSFWVEPLTSAPATWLLRTAQT
ncbi:MAG TPA: hypothetical protein VFL83_02465 [Anaeromyxobacter sp.]|nr:hypothetical protein [Anaeromyxobacter sp.]